MPIDLTARATSAYCERTSSDFWSESLNATTSIVVIVVAVAGFIQLWRRGLLSPTVILLMVLAIAIGVGSFLLHTFATVWAEIVDVLSIWTFVAVYGLLALRHFAPDRFSLPFASLFCLGVFVSGMALGIGDPTGMSLGLSGSAQYVPATLMIASVVYSLWKARHPSLLRLGLGIGMFVLALAFRSLDLWVCDSFPNGTHFLWHITNTLVFWYLIETYAIHVSNPPGSGRQTGLVAAR